MNQDTVGSVYQRPPVFTHSGKVYWHSALFWSTEEGKRFFAGLRWTG